MNPSTRRLLGRAKRKLMEAAAFKNFAGGPIRTYKWHLGSSPWSAIVKERPGVTHKIYTTASAEILRSQVKRIRSLTYSKPNRSVWSLVQGSLALDILSSRESADRRISVLTIGYGHDTYDVQLLAKNGFEVELSNVDVLDFDISNPNWAAFAGKYPSKYVQADARRLEAVLGNAEYDLILIGRGSVDLMSPADFRMVWDQSIKLLRKNGSLVGPVKCIEFSALRAATAGGAVRENGSQLSQSPIVYRSAIGEFRIGGISQAGYFPEPQDFLRRDNPNVIQMVAEELTAYAEWSGVPELSDLLQDCPDSLGFLRAFLGYYRSYYEPLNIRDLSGDPEVRSVDIKTSKGPAPFFSMRATLVGARRDSDEQGHDGTVE